MHIVIGADGLDDAGAGGAGGLQGDLGFFENIQHIRQIFAVEGDLGFAALDDGIDFAHIVADFLGTGGDGHLAGGEFAAGSDDQADDAGAVAGEDGGRLGGPQEFGHIYRGLGAGALGDKLFVLRESALDELGDQLDILQFEEYLALIGVDS